MLLEMKLKHVSTLLAVSCMQMELLETAANEWQPACTIHPWFTTCMHNTDGSQPACTIHPWFTTCMHNTSMVHNLHAQYRHGSQPACTIQPWFTACMHNTAMVHNLHAQYSHGSQPACTIQTWFTACMHNTAMVHSLHAQYIHGSQPACTIQTWFTTCMHNTSMIHNLHAQYRHGSQLAGTVHLTQPQYSAQSNSKKIQTGSNPMLQFLESRSCKSSEEQQHETSVAGFSTRTPRCNNNKKLSPDSSSVVTVSTYTSG